MKKVCLWWPFLCTFSETYRWVILSYSLLHDIPKVLYCAMVMFLAIQVATVFTEIAIEYWNYFCRGY